MPKASTKATALDLAKDVARYNRMADAGKAWQLLHREWPPEVARLIESALWSKIKWGSEKQILADLRAVQKKAAARSGVVHKMKAAARVK
jgi:hypothetical protein